MWSMLQQRSIKWLDVHMSVFSKSSHESKTHLSLLVHSMYDCSCSLSVRVPRWWLLFWPSDGYASEGHH